MEFYGRGDDANDLGKEKKLKFDVETFSNK